MISVPYVTLLTLLRLEDLLSYRMNGNLCPCPSARRLCQLMIDFVRTITSARRETLEQGDSLIQSQAVCIAESPTGRMQGDIQAVFSRFTTLNYSHYSVFDFVGIITIHLQGTESSSTKSSLVKVMMQSQKKK